MTDQTPTPAAAEVIDVEPDEVLFTRALLTAALVKLILGQKDKNARALDDRLRKGTKETAAHPKSGLPLGTVSKSFPDPKAVVKDAAKLDEHLRTTRPKELELSPVLGPIEEVAAVLAEHAPRLLTVEEVVPEWMVAEAQREAESGRDVPGIELALPPGVVSVRPNDLAVEVVREVLGTSALPILAAIKGGAQ